MWISPRENVDHTQAEMKNVIVNNLVVVVVVVVVVVSISSKCGMNNTCSNKSTKLPGAHKQQNNMKKMLKQTQTENFTLVTILKKTT